MNLLTSDWPWLAVAGAAMLTFWLGFATASILFATRPERAESLLLDDVYRNELEIDTARECACRGCAVRLVFLKDEREELLGQLIAERAVRR